MSKYKLLILICLISVLFVTSCAKNKGIILFNSVPITQNNILHDEKNFREGSRVYFIYLAPEKMQNEFIRVQIFKMTDKAEYGGYDVVRTKDYRLKKNERYYYTDYFTLWEKGKYVMQVFSHSDFTRPIGINFFYVN